MTYGGHVHLDSLNMLLDGDLYLIIFDTRHHAHTIQDCGIFTFQLCLQQEMRQNGLPLSIAALELVLPLLNVTLFDWKHDLET